MTGIDDSSDGTSKSVNSYVPKHHESFGSRNSDDRFWTNIQKDLLENNEKQTVILGQIAERLAGLYSFVARREDDLLYVYHDEEYIYYDDGETVVSEIMAKNLTAKVYEDRLASKVVEKIRASRRVPGSEIGSVVGKLCLENGFLDISDPQQIELEEPHAGHLFTSKIKPEYDETADCPMWLNFLDEAVPDKSAQKKLQEYAGYCLHHWSQPFKKALLLTGPTDSGKGTFLSVVEAVFGNENVSNETLKDLVDSRWSTAQLSRGYINIRNEMTANSIRHSEKFKELTGGNDTISSEDKGDDKFQHSVTQKFLFATNQVPDAESDNAFHNRWLHVRFPNSVPEEEKDPQLVNKIVENELSGVFNWMIEGYQRLMDQGGFTDERSIAEKRSFWNQNSDSVSQFVEEYIERKPQNEIPEEKVKDSYRDFCANEGLTKIWIGKLTTRLKSVYNVSQVKRGPKGEQEPCYKGIDMVGDNTEGDDDESETKSPWPE